VPVMFVHITRAAFPEVISRPPAGRPKRGRESCKPRQAVADVTRADGSVASTMIDTVNGYSYTPLAALEAASCPGKHFRLTIRRLVILALVAMGPF
jgi:hypothetical protein